jgi:ribosomal protein S18 acetylase RimI-like enzyme
MGGIEVRPFREEDAAGVAELLNASDAAWPGTFTGGIPYTAERVLRNRAEEAPILDLVAAEGEKILGYCTLTRDWRDPGALYVGFLNVHPAYHGRGIGKRLLLGVLEEAIRRGAPYVSLNTWSGNERAIGLYKSLGFFWVPGTNVRMENFLPAVLGNSWVKEFLGNAKWLECLRREISLEEDREEWRGRGVYRYRFERAGGLLEVVIDREAKRPCALISPRFSAELWTEPGSPHSILPFDVHWRLENKGEKPLVVAVFARGDPGIEISGGELVSLEPGAERAGTHRCVASLLESDPRRPAPAARLSLLSQGRALELASGIRPRPPLELSAGPEPPVIRPDTPAVIRLFLTNPTSYPLSGRIHLSADGVSDLRPRSFDFSLSSRETKTLELEVVASSGGYVLSGTVELRDGGSYDMPPVPLLVRGPGEVAGCLLGDRAVVAGDAGWLEARARDGRLAFFRYGEAHPLMRQGEELGPPFYPVDLAQRAWTLGIRRERGGVSLWLEAQSGRFPGIRVRKEILIHPGQVLEVSHRLSSRRDDPISLKLSLYHWDLPDLPWRVAFRTEDGLIRDLLGTFPRGEADFPSELAEGWLALETEGWTIGLIPATEVKWDCEWGWSWKTETLEIPPGGEVEASGYAIYLGPGNFETVRTIWAEISGASVVPEAPRPFVWVDPPGPLLVGEEGELVFTVRTARGRPFSGSLALEPPEGMEAAPREFKVSNVTPGTPAMLRANWKRVRKRRASLGKLVLRGMGEERQFPWPAVFLPPEAPKAGATEAQGKDAFFIRAGESEFTLVPSFAGGLVSWREKDVEQLFSAFPEPRAFAWLSPWFGGIHPFLYELSLDEWNWPGKLYEEEFRGEIWQGELRGVKAAGVRLRCEPKGEGLEDLDVEVLYASVGPGILFVQLRVGNCGRPRRLGGGFTGFLSPGGDRREAVIESPGHVRVRSQFHAFYRVSGWAKVKSPGRGAILAISSDPIAIWDAGEEGGHVGIERCFALKPGEDRILRCWFVYLGPSEPLDPWLSLVPGLASPRLPAEG